MATSGKSITAKVQRHVETKLKIRRCGFVKSYRLSVFDKKPSRMPSMAIGSKGHFTGILERGGTVRPRGRLLLIPFGNQRVGPKAFRTLIRNLMSRGDGYFREVNGRLILFAENQKENDRDTRRFKRAERNARGVKSLKRGADIPIAVGITEARITKRTDVFGTVKRLLPEIASAIETEVARSMNGR